MCVHVCMLWTYGLRRHQIYHYCGETTLITSYIAKLRELCLLPQVLQIQLTTKKASQLKHNSSLFNQKQAEMKKFLLKGVALTSSSTEQ